jgi:ABC-type lipoprotein export system ATPase subunit
MSTAKNDYIIEVKDVYHSYKLGNNNLEILKGINFSMVKGQWCCLLGASGSGKTTLMNLIGGLEKPTKGIIKIANEDITKYSRNNTAKFRAEKIGFIFQSYHLLPEFTILENVAISGTLANKSWKSAKAKALTLLTAVGLENRVNHRPSELSGGEQQRAAIARALINDPELILADEPTGNLDGKTGDEILSLLEDIRKSRPNCSILMITHNREISKLANQTIEIKDGVII